MAWHYLNVFNTFKAMYTNMIDLYKIKYKQIAYAQIMA